MLTREQVYAMLLIRKREGNIFSEVPREIFDQITGYTFCVTGSEIAKALKYAADAREEAIDKVVAMVEKNPHLLLEAGNVITPGGLHVMRVTLYEFFLGAGDPIGAERIKPFFAKIANGEKERDRQFERYRPCIEGMLTQEPYDLTPIIKLIKQSPAEDITAALEKNMDHVSPLHHALIQFRKDHAPGVLMKPRMHYNYASLQHAYHTLNQVSENTLGTRLVLRQLIGFELRDLPGVDRCLFSQGLDSVVKNDTLTNRSYQFANDNGDFPITAGDNSSLGLGFDFSVDTRGARGTVFRRHDFFAASHWESHVKQKYLSYRTPAATLTSNDNETNYRKEHETTLNYLVSTEKLALPAAMEELSELNSDCIRLLRKLYTLGFRGYDLRRLQFENHMRLSQISIFTNTHQEVIQYLIQDIKISRHRALCEVIGLNDGEILALQLLYNKGLNRQLLKTWKPLNNTFTETHARALEYLVTKRKFKIKDAITYIDKMSEYNINNAVDYTDYLPTLFKFFFIAIGFKSFMGLSLTSFTLLSIGLIAAASAVGASIITVIKSMFDSFTKPQTPDHNINKATLLAVAILLASIGLLTTFSAIAAAIINATKYICNSLMKLPISDHDSNHIIPTLADRTLLAVRAPDALTSTNAANLVVESQQITNNIEQEAQINDQIHPRR